MKFEKTAPFVSDGIGLAFVKFERILKFNLEGCSEDNAQKTVVKFNIQKKNPVIDKPAPIELILLIIQVIVQLRFITKKPRR